MRKQEQPGSQQTQLGREAGKAPEGGWQKTSKALCWLLFPCLRSSWGQQLGGLELKGISHCCHLYRDPLQAPGSPTH